MLAESKKAVDIHVTIIDLLEKKGIDESNIRFSGLDGMNAMSGEIKGLQRLLRHDSPHPIYINCRNHRLVHLIPKNGKLRVRLCTHLTVENVQIQLYKTSHF